MVNRIVIATHMQIIVSVCVDILRVDMMAMVVVMVQGTVDFCVVVVLCG
jgi:hypothetical protein